jgi:DNA-directed RNA polymerase subunit beta'
MLTSGSINLHELMSLKGVEETQRYIMNEIASIYSSQGHFIGGVHLEIIVRQMFSRVTIEESGDSEFVNGDIVSKAAVVEENARLVSEGRNPASFTQMLLGITKVSAESNKCQVHSIQHQQFRINQQRRAKAFY